MKLRIAETLELPIEAATQTFLVVGKRGSGKTTTCVRLAEQFFRARVPFVVVDPVDSWWGLKAARDGKGPGLGVYVFGGRHADPPLEPTAGGIIADALIEHNFSAVLSIKHFSGRERGRFVAEFAARLFQKNNGARHVFLEEAHEVAPQNPFKGEEEMLGHVTRIWKLGRSSGLGGSAVTQRPASLSKNITTQAEILIVHRLLGPQDVAAVREWIRYHGEREDILAQLSTLKTGEGFVWAPDFPEGKPIGLQRVRMLDRETFDSSATPRAGHVAAEPKALAPVDLERLSKQMAATIEKAKADDPRELRQRIVALQREFAEVKKAAPAPAKVERVEVPVLKPEDVARLEAAVTAMDAAVQRMLAPVQEAAGALEASARDLWAALHAGAQQRGKALREPGIYATAPNRTQQPTVPLVRALRQAPVTRSDRKRSTDTFGQIGKGERRILTAVAQYPDGAAREQLTILTGYKRSSRDTYLQRLSQRALVETGTNGDLVVTDAGIAVLGDDFEPLPTGAELRRYWLERLSGGERALLQEIVQAYPRTVHREALTVATDYKRSSRDTYLQRVAARRVIVAGARGEVRASDMLFE